MYIYHALINALSTQMIHIKLNIILYTHVEHSPIKTIYIKFYMEKGISEVCLWKYNLISFVHQCFGIGPYAHFVVCVCMCVCVCVCVVCLCLLCAFLQMHA